MFHTAKATTVLKIPSDRQHQSAYIAGQYYFTDGPTENPQGFSRANIFAKFHTHITPNSMLGLSIAGFTSGWNASGQIPQRAVDRGLISRWGSVDNMEGGATGRYNASVNYHFMEGYEHDLQIQAYATKYDFKLYSDFTYWLNDTVNGDMIEQNDHRVIYGLNTRYSFFKSFGNIRSYTKVGGTYRSDHTELSLWHSPDRNRMNVLTDHSVVETNMAFWMEEDLVFSRLFKIEAGLRGDYFVFDVRDHLEKTVAADNGLPHVSGYDQAGILSPNLNLVLSPTRYLDIYQNGGTGFHSNDARDVIIAYKVNQMIRSGRSQRLTSGEIEQRLQEQHLDLEYSGITTLPRATGAEIGFKLGSGNHFLMSMAGWFLHLEEELVFVGDEGSTEISGPTRRIGIDSEIRLQFAKWIWADFDLNLSDGRYVNEPEGADYIPLAPRISSQGGINFIHTSGIEGAVRYRLVGDRPANEDNSVQAKGYFIGNIILAYRFLGFKIFTELDNVLNSTWNEAQFDTESRLFDEPSPVSELHFTPGNPRNIQVGISYEF